MESLLGLAAAHWDHEPVWIVWSVRSPAFRRPGPAKAGTPNVRFMESPLSIFRMHWDHEPKMRNLFICKGSILRFMESFLPCHKPSISRKAICELPCIRSFAAGVLLSENAYEIAHLKNSFVVGRVRNSH